jgi:Peptidase A4 family
MDTAMKSDPWQPDPITDLRSDAPVGSLLTRVSDFPPPPDGFNPLTANQDKLDKYGLPPRPEPALQPELYKLWLGMFAPPITFVTGELVMASATWQLNPTVTRTAQSYRASGSRSRGSTSRNWSGATLIPTGGDMCTQVWGRWTVPTPALPAAEFQIANTPAYCCSTWVGLDGQRHYLNSSLPQTGTMQFLQMNKNGSPEVRVLPFFQWWDSETGGPFIRFHKLIVQPTDVVGGLIWADTETSVRAYLRNFTTGHMRHVKCTAPIVTPPGGVPLQLTISGATAEWVLERPTRFNSTELYAFPDYDEATFTHCGAGLAPAAGTPHSVRHLRRAELMRMYDTLQNPSRTVYISMPDRLDRAGFHVSYGDFKD